MSIKKIHFTNDTDIRLGFEIECVINGEMKYWDKFTREIRAVNRNIDVGDDGSIDATDGFDFDGNEMDVELRTNPLPPKIAMENLKSIFDIVDTYGGTNKSCGLHVNISSKKYSKMRNFNPLIFLSSNIWERILFRFARTNNEYCQFNGIKKDSCNSNMTLMHQFSEDVEEKYNCVNFTNFGYEIDNNSRIEIRGFGNKDYHLRYDLIAYFVKKIEELFNISCETIKVPRIRI